MMAPEIDLAYQMLVKALKTKEAPTYLNRVQHAKDVLIALCGDMTTEYVYLWRSAKMEERFDRGELVLIGDLIPRLQQGELIAVYDTQAGNYILDCHDDTIGCYATDSIARGYGCITSQLISAPVVQARHMLLKVTATFPDYDAVIAAVRANPAQFTDLPQEGVDDEALDAHAPDCDCEHCRPGDPPIWEVQ